MAYPSGIQIAFHLVLAASSQAILMFTKLLSVSKYTSVT